MTKEQPRPELPHDPEAPTIDIPADSQKTPPLEISLKSSQDSFAGNERIGNYRIIRAIGEGGMGTVYQAEQESPSRTVALKVIRAGVATPSLLRRFEHEAEILGKLDHPGIATIFEAGTFDAGAGPQPFFAMELVKGKPLTEYADDKKLGTRQRLELLARIAEAVQHAHHKGVIHRDLKPCNILITDDGQVKILDFGIARATDADTQTATLQTDIGQLIGTIPYMSPEQAVGDPDDLDTRSDVYALGVVAYELLTGRMPYNLKRKMIHEAVRVIRETTPTPLSSINRVFRGDVEIIISKALVKEKEHRYQSASDFASDIHRYLKNEPIIARAPSTWYQFSKFTKRNKALVAGVIAVVMVSIIGAIVSASFAIGEAEQKRIAVENAKTAQDALIVAEEKTTEAQRERAIAQSINDFLNDRLLGSAAPEKEGRDVLVRDMLLKAATELDTNPPKFKKVEAALRLTIGRTYTGLGYFSDGEIHLRKAVELWEQLEGSDSLVTAEAVEALTFALMRTNKFDEAYTLAKRVLAIRNQKLGPNDPLTLRSQGDVVMFEAFQRGEAAGGLNNTALNLILAVQGKNETPEQLQKRLNDTILNLEILVAANQMEQAINVLHEEAKPFLALPWLRDRVSWTLASYSIPLTDKGLFRAAEAMALYAVQNGEKNLNPDHPYTLHSLLSMYYTLHRQGRLQDAYSYLSRCLIGRRQVLSDDHTDTLFTINSMGKLLEDMGNFDEAEKHYKEAIERSSQKLGEDHISTLNYTNNLAFLLESQNKLPEAEIYFRKEMDGRRRTQGDDNLDTLYAIDNMGVLLRKMDQLIEAESLGAEAVQRGRKTLQPDDWHLGLFLGHYAVTLNNMDRFKESEKLALEAHTIMNAARGASHKLTTEIIQQLVDLYQAWHLTEPNAGYDAKAGEWRGKIG